MLKKWFSGLNKTWALVVCSAGYLIAFLAALAVVMALHGHNLILTFCLADLAATIVIFVFSVLSDNSSFYDPYWSVAPVPIVLFLAFQAETLNPREWAIITLLLIWAARLTWNWGRRWRGFKDEDWRYAGFRKTAKSWYWPLSFAGFHFFPTVIVFAGCLPIFSVFLNKGYATNGLDIAALVVTLCAILIEATADKQLWEFKKKNKKKKQILSTGLWAWARHPNYFGEVLFWWGIWLFSIANGPIQLYLLAGPACVTLLFIFISVPMADQRMLIGRPAYTIRMKRVPSLLPHPFGRKTAAKARSAA